MEEIITGNNKDTTENNAIINGPCLNASTFSIPVSTPNSHYELWSVRVPVDCDVAEVFHGKTLKIIRHGAGSQSITITNMDGEVAHALVPDEGTSFQSHRVLSRVDDDSISQDDMKGKLMKPVYKFDKAFNFIQDINMVQNVLVLPQHEVDLKLAPSSELAPACATASSNVNRGRASALPTQTHSFRAAYEPILQKQNLKRRLIPPGSCSEVALNMSQQAADRENLTIPPELEAKKCKKKHKDSKTKVKKEHKKHSKK